MTKDEELYPLPEIIDGGEWTIDRGLRHKVDLNSRGTGGSMAVPLGGSERDRVLKQRAIARTKWSPRIIKGRRKDLSDEVINRAEEARITRLLMDNTNATSQKRITSTPTLEDFELAKLAAEAFRTRSILPMASALLSVSHTEDSNRLIRALAAMAGEKEDEDAAESELNKLSAARQIVMEAKKKFNRNIHNFKKSTLAAAEYLTDACEEYDNAEKRRREAAGRRAEGKPKTPEEEEEERKLAEEMERSREEAENRIRMSERRVGHYDDDYIRPGTLEEIVRNPLTIPIKAKVRSKKYRASDSGAVLRYPHRVLTDSQVFRRRVPKPGGTLLIDQSGSMSFTTEELEELITLLPAATIAGYSGEGHTGDIRIFAEKGRRCPTRFLTEYPGKHYLAGGFYPGMNVVDVPALEWLGSKDGPRIWVCDGGVTGVDDGMAPNITKACYDLVLKHRIIRVGHVGGAREIAKKLVKR